MHQQMRRTLRVPAAISLAVLGVLATSRLLASDTDEWEPVLRLVEKIKEEPAVNSRTEQAEKLAHVVREKEGKKAPKGVIRAIADLMTDRHDSVRYWAATALGYLGPQAADAIPALQKALKEIEGRRASKTSESAIRLALERINRPQK
jgi:hypothetical protein